MTDAISRVVTIRRDGSVSMKITVTKLAKLIGAEVGDQVKITMGRIDED